ncbi:unnamed protein product [Rhizoctonia solani]|uniref:F-box domain-containing protein n=1 Tax=Rhizoctonia solani TaxID=456999 RepID=A0A8H3AI53_9AGAM|nr:unnamed protein product [Rhizoctonia solani]CAE6475474.1 unnamed protein product [Rhizoctonia solani]
MLLSTPHGAQLARSPTRSSLALRCIFPTFAPLAVPSRRVEIIVQSEETVRVECGNNRRRHTVTCLPNEILTIIVKLVSVHDLTSVVQVCQRLHSVGMRVLYSSISLVDTITLDVKGNPDTLIKTSQCCATVVRRPLLANIVFRLRIELKESSNRVDWKLPGSVIAPIGTMLRQLPKLAQLELCVLGTSLAEILSGCPFSLKTFSCDTCDPRPLHAFLISQPELTELHLVGPTQPVGSFFLNYRYAQKLRKVSGTLDVVASVVPGRPIEEIRIVDAFLNTEMIRTRINLLTASRSAVKVFRIVTVICQVSMIEVIAEHLPKIEVLGLHVLAPSDRHIPYVNLLDSIAPVIQMLPRLERLDACGTDEYEHAHWLEHLAKEKKLLELWSSISNTLTFVKFPTGAEWARRDGIWAHVHATPDMYHIEHLNDSKEQI